MESRQLRVKLAEKNEQLECVRQELTQLQEEEEFITECRLAAQAKALKKMFPLFDAGTPLNQAEPFNQIEWTYPMAQSIPVAKKYTGAQPLPWRRINGRRRKRRRGAIHPNLSNDPTNQIVPTLCDYEQTCVSDSRLFEVVRAFDFMIAGQLRF